MASKRRCILCGKGYSRSKGRNFGTSFCSDRCRWEARKIPIDVVFKRDDGTCHLCWKPVERSEASRDHIKPKSLGGRMVYDNIALSHASCNSRRGSLSVDVFRAKIEALLNSRVSAENG